MANATGRARTEATEELTRLDARLLMPDPDLEELFAEIEEALCQARDRWRFPLPREPRMPWPRPGPGSRRWRAARLHARPPAAGPGRQRGPPGVRGRPRCGIGDGE
ncbi:hypothetical protein [Nocardia jiangxiensis]|uniref:hypothetical protein n=1 Tax=Nocardia jiangxiensis TaxID=282685 RepID=UPI0012F6C727|nr:hypothetical protein [Nocardia jiangxiensis]